MTRNLVRFTDHAIERYVERVRPALGRDGAVAEMLQLVSLGQLVSDAPPWHGDAEVPPDTIAFLDVGDVVMTLVRARDDRSAYLATTVIVKGSIPTATRASRNQNRSKRGTRKHARKVTERHLTRAKSPGRIRLANWED